MSEMQLDPKYDHYDYPTTAPEVKPGHPGHLSEQQQAQVSQLRMMLEAEGCTKRLDTLTLLRFLRARKFDVNAAKAMFINSEKWRAGMWAGGKALEREKGDTTKVNLDETIAGWDTDGSFKRKVSARYKQFYHKTDKDGRPVYIEQLGGIDLYAMANEGITEDKMLINLAVEYEKMADPRLPACSRKAGQLLETCTSIMDLKGVGLSNAGSVYGYIRKASEMSNNCYPERLGHMYLINCPWGFGMVWNAVKGFLDPVTASKIHVCGSSWQKEVGAQVPKENLPSIYSGTCKCEGGCENSDAGPWREAEYSRPAWWEKAASEETTETKPTEAEVPAESDAAAEPAPVAA